MLLFGPPRCGKSQLLRRAASAAGAAAFSLEPAAVEAAAPAFEELYLKIRGGGRGGGAAEKDNGSSAPSSLPSLSPSSCSLVVAAAFAAARACSCPSIVHLPRAEAFFVSDAGGGNRGARLAGTSLPPAASILPALAREASRLRARERVVVVGESSRPQEASGRRDAAAMARFFAGGILPVGPPSGAEERRAVVVAVAEASGARLEGMMAAPARAREARAAAEKMPTDAAAEASPKPTTPKQATSASADLEALFFTAEGWVAGDLACAVRGALEARRRRREGEKGRSGAGGSSSVAGGESGAEAEEEKASSSSSSPPPLCGPLTAREIVDTLLSGPRPPKASELAAALDWARAAAAAAATAEGEEVDGGGEKATTKTSKTKERAPSAAAKRDTEV